MNDAHNINCAWSTDTNNIEQTIDGMRQNENNVQIMLGRKHKSKQ